MPEFEREREKERESESEASHSAFPQELRTNREFYLALSLLIKGERDNDITLEQYLQNLERHTQEMKSRDFLSLNEVFTLLAASFAKSKLAANYRSSPARAEQTATSSLTPKSKLAGFEQWNTVIRRQIKDLREMDEHGMFQNEYRYLGLNAPSRQRWYNFDPITYIECASAGSMGGWEEGDDTGRSYVPGEVVVMAASGQTIACDPRTLNRKPRRIARLSWEDFTEFLNCGQWYE